MMFRLDSFCPNLEAGLCKVADQSISEVNVTTFMTAAKHNLLETRMMSESQVQLERITQSAIGRNHVSGNVPSRESLDPLNPLVATNRRKERGRETQIWIHQGPCSMRSVAQTSRQFVVGRKIKGQCCDWFTGSLGGIQPGKEFSATRPETVSAFGARPMLGFPRGPFPLSSRAYPAFHPTVRREPLKSLDSSSAL
jgi:hypothetical protein